MGYHTPEQAERVLGLARDATGWAAARGMAWTPLLDVLDLRGNNDVMALLRAHLEQHPGARDPEVAHGDLRHFRSHTLRRWLATVWGERLRADLVPWVAEDHRARATLLSHEGLRATHRAVLLDAVLRDNGSHTPAHGNEPASYRVLNGPSEELQQLVGGGLPGYAHSGILRALEGYRRSGRSEDAEVQVRWRRLLLDDPTLSIDILHAVARLAPRQALPSVGVASSIAKAKANDVEFFSQWATHPAWGPEGPSQWLQTVATTPELTQLFRQILLSSGSPTSQRGQLAAPVIAQVAGGQASQLPTVRAWIDSVLAETDLTVCVLEHPLITLLMSGGLAAADALALTTVIVTKLPSSIGAKLAQHLATSPLAHTTPAVTQILLTIPPPVLSPTLRADLLKRHARALPASVVTANRDLLWKSIPMPGPRLALMRDLLPSICAPGHGELAAIEASWRPWMSSADTDQRVLAVEAFRQLRGVAGPAPKTKRSAPRPKQAP